MDIELEIKLAKFEHEYAVLNARKLELKKQLLESKKTLAMLEQETAKVNERLKGTQEQIDNLLNGG